MAKYGLFRQCEFVVKTLMYLYILIYLIFTNTGIQYTIHNTHYTIKNDKYIYIPVYIQMYTNDTKRLSIYKHAIYWFNIQITPNITYI